MKIRSVTAALYVLVLIGFFLLKIFVHMAFFDALIVLFSVIGTFEMTRALGDKIRSVQKWIVMFFSTAILVSFSISDIVYRYIQESSPEQFNYSVHITCVVFMAGLALLFGLLVFSHEKTSLESTAYSLFSLIFPSVFLLVLMGCNHLPRYSEISILFVFAVCPVADCFAQLTGMALGKKFPKKMSPTVSPNKTVVGGIGSLVGGALAAVAIFFAYYGLVQPADFSAKWTNLIFFVGLGVLTALFAEFGDLVESAIKRKLQIKDMGKILPGHGGILDRIDSSLYACLIVCFVMVIRIMTTG